MFGKNVVNLLIILTFILLSCESQKEEKSGPETKESPEMESKLYTERGDTLIIRNDSFIDTPFRFNTNIKNLLKNQQDVKILEKEIIENRHMEGVMDTIFTIGNGESQFQIYKAKSKEILFDAVIRSDQFALDRGIQTGIEENSLLKKFSIQPEPAISPKVVIITNSLETSEIIFNFDNRRLREIVYNGYLD